MLIVSANPCVPPPSDILKGIPSCLDDKSFNSLKLSFGNSFEYNTNLLFI